MSNNVSTFFRDNFSQFRPSRVHGEYRRTFAYRLSELVFGSLIASYILGFLGLASSLVRENELLDIVSYFDPFLPSIATGMPIIVKLYIIFIYIVISFIYALFTALIYFNFHQSILYIQRSDKNAANDYLTSLLVAVMFGLSMLAPRFAVGFFFILAATVLRKKNVASDTYLKSISGHILNMLRKDDQQEGWTDDERDPERDRIREGLKSAMASVGKTPGSWLAEPTRNWAKVCYLITFVWTVVVYFGFMKWGESSISPIQMFIICGVHAAVLSIVAYFLMKSLTDATKKLAAGDNENYQDAVDRQFLLVLKSANELFKGTHIPEKVEAALKVQDPLNNSFTTAEDPYSQKENASEKSSDLG